MIELKPVRKPVEKIEADLTYWYANFEADTSGEIHIPFMCAVQNIAGNVSRELEERIVVKNY